VIALFKQFPSSSFVTFYLRAGKIGSGFYNFDPESPANDAMVKEFQTIHAQSIASAKNSLDRWEKRCKENPGDILCPLQLPEEQEILDAELSRTEEYLVGVAIRGPARDLGLLSIDPRVFSTNIESGTMPSGIPFYPSIKDVHRWTP
jgi:hypothetical protein